jgi:hypothetical protein
MTKKVLFWIDSHFLPYCMAYYLQNKFDAKMYAVFDVTNRTKIFFESQNLVNFQEQWFYHDNINFKNPPDIQFLQKFEEKYDINLWNLALNERLLYQYNAHHHFVQYEIESILTQECKLFETILDKINPDYLVTKDTALHHNHLLYLMCKKRGIKVLMMNYTKIGNNFIISEDIYKLDSFTKTNDDEIKKRSFKDLQLLLKSNNNAKNLKIYIKKRTSSKLTKFFALTEYIFKSDNSNIKTHYSYFGRTKIRVLFKEFYFILKTKYRKSFIDKNLINKVNQKEKYVLFPLHQEPERSLLIAAPYFTNQLETIRHVAKSLPPGYVLYVKEHYAQSLREWREISYYKKILEIPNVKLFHPSSSMEELIINSSLVIAVSGTAAFEANFYEKPSIIFSDMGFSKLSSVFLIDSLNKLPSVIRTALKQKVNLKELDEYVTTLEKNSFNFDFIDYTLQEANWFRFGGNYADSVISNKKMTDFLLKYKKILDDLSTEYMRKIKHIESIN